MVWDFLTMLALPLEPHRTHVGIHAINPMWGVAGGMLSVVLAVADTPVWLSVFAPTIASMTAITIAWINRKADATVIKKQLRSEIEANWHLRKEIQHLKAKIHRTEGESD